MPERKKEGNNRKSLIFLLARSVKTRNFTPFPPELRKVMK